MQSVCMRQLLVLVLQKYLSRVFKGALVCGLFAAIFRGQSNNNPTVHQVYVYIIKVGALSLLCRYPQSDARQQVLSDNHACVAMCVLFECRTLLKNLL